MKIRIVYGRIKYKFREAIIHNKFIKLYHVMKILKLPVSSFFRLLSLNFKNRMTIVSLSKITEVTDLSLREFAALKYLNGSLFIINNDLSQNSLEYQRIINKYYLKLIGGHNDD